MFISNSSVPLSISSSDDFRTSRVMNLFLNAMNTPEMRNAIAGMKQDVKNMESLDSYSIYEWNDLIQIILG